MLDDITEQLHSSKALLQLWQRYQDYSRQCASAARQQEDRASELLKAATSKDIADDEVAAWIQDCNVCSGMVVFSQLCFLRRLTRLVLMRVSFWYVSIWVRSYPQIIVLSIRELARFSGHTYQLQKAPPVVLFTRRVVFPFFLMGYNPCE